MIDVAKLERNSHFYFKTLLSWAMA